jgi:hypothetical protein
LIAEFDGSTGNLKKEYLYGGATLITIEPTAVNSNGTQYTTSDNLGSALGRAARPVAFLRQVN